LTDESSSYLAKFFEPPEKDYLDDRQMDVLEKTYIVTGNIAD